MMGERIAAPDMTVKGALATHRVWTRSLRVQLNGRQEALKAPLYPSTGA
jgi:hypothetical protein